jgi:phosphoserine aminotransferase
MGSKQNIASSEDKTFSYIPDCSDLPISEECGLCLYFVKTTQYMEQSFKELPNTKGKILVSDVSSCFLSEPVDVTKNWYYLWWSPEK